MTDHLRAIIYSRVSTDAQERDGTSLDTQNTPPRNTSLPTAGCFWRPLGTPPVVPAWTAQGIERLRLQLRQGSVDVVVAYAVDRLSRNQNHIGVLFDEVNQAGRLRGRPTSRYNPAPNSSFSQRSLKTRPPEDSSSRRAVSLAR